MQPSFPVALAVAVGTLACEADPPAVIVPDGEVPASHAPAQGTVGDRAPAAVESGGASGGADGLLRAKGPEHGSGGVASTGGAGNDAPREQNVGGGNAAGSGGSAGAAGSSNDEPIIEEHRYALLQAAAPGALP